MPDPTVFTTEQVKALCGGELPLAEHFAWERAECFHLEEGVLQPYAGDEILPMPGITVLTGVESWPFSQPRT